MKRCGAVIEVKAKELADYKYHHAHIWPEINAKIKECNISNYSIYNFGKLLFSYMEYTGTDYEKDMAKMAADPKTQEWWNLVMPFQRPIEGRKDGEWWADMEEVYHLD